MNQTLTADLESRKSIALNAQSQLDALRQSVDQALHFNAEHNRQKNILQDTVESQQLELEQLVHHTYALEISLRDMHRSWSWKLTAPLRFALDLLRLGRLGQPRAKPNKNENNAR